jgi:hypothetical protein|tara:strand:+ start:70 stop:423 length:354 start_codon:yes stop_codon:yes gene_type:complete
MSIGVYYVTHICTLVSYAYENHYVHTFGNVLLSDQNFGGTFNAHKHWKKIREKHRKAASGEKPWVPESYVPSGGSLGLEGQTRNVSKELYDLNHDLAFGRITEEEYEHKRAKLDLGQ